MRQPLYLRLRPFLRRELRARLVSAVVTVFVLCGLTWLGVSALTKIDSREAHDLRVAIGLEGPWTVCGEPGGPLCSYEDREQARIDAKHEHERRLRLAVLDEMERRIAHAQDRLDEATEIVEDAKLNPRSGALQGDTVALRQALSSAAVDLRPAPLTSVEGRRERLLWALDVAMPEIPGDCRDIDFDGIGWVGGCDLTRSGSGDGMPANRVDQRRLVLEQIALERNTLATLGKRIDALQARDQSDGELEDDTESRVELVGDLVPARELTSDYQEKMAVAAWLAVGSGEEAYDDDGTSSLVAVARTSGLGDVGEDLSAVANAYIVDLARLVQDPGAAGWQGGWLLDGAERVAISKPSVRYRSPITTSMQVRLFASLLMLLGAIMLVVVGPTVTATTTAREREAGTLPVLRMTGLSAGDIAMAMTIGPNVFALVAGGALVLVSATMLAATAGMMTTLSLLGVVLAMSTATYLTAIGLGDALGQRVNAMVVGGLLGLGVLVPGLVGATMVVGDMAATGLLLGPLPATIGSIVSATGLPYARMLSATSSSLAQQMLVFSMVAQAMLGAMCLLSWRRRVEQPWAPLFRPIEGALLGLISVGCSALALLDLSEQIHVQTYDQVNLVTFVATGFLMPVLGWLLVSSLVRPARAAAVASCSEARRAFGRFQLFVLLTSAALAGAYSMVLDRSGLGNEKSEIMWATIAQGLLVAETAVATLLLASRRREGRHRVLILGATIVLLQLALVAGVYNIEVEHVAMTQSAAHPLLVGMDASPYWVAFLVVLWAAGLGLMLAALLRERDRSKAEATADEPEPEGDGDGEDEQRWLH